MMEDMRRLPREVQRQQEELARPAQRNQVLEWEVAPRRAEDVVMLAERLMSPSTTGATPCCALA